MKLSEKLVKLRKGSGMTQEELAAKLYVTRTAVSKWENDKGYPGIDSLKLLSQVYGVSLDELISEDDVENARKIKAKRSRIFYWCAAGALVFAAAFAAAAGFSGIPWFIIPSAVGVVAYVVFAFLTRPAASGMSRGDFTRWLAARIIVLLIVIAALLTTFIETFA